MRTKYTEKNGSVFLECDNASGERETTEYFLIGSSVCRYDEKNAYRQVANGLADKGWFLQATVESLPSVIRREYRRAVASDRKHLQSSFK